MRVTESIGIERPPADVWAVVSDLSTHAEWRPAIVELAQVSSGPLEVGSRLSEVLLWRGRELVLDDVVTGLEPPRRLAIHGGWSAAGFDLELLLEPAGDGTRVTMDWPLHPKSLLLRVAAPFLGGTMRKATGEELELLKQYVERR